METATAVPPLDVPFDLLGTADAPVVIPVGMVFKSWLVDPGPESNVWPPRLEVVLTIGPDQPPSPGAAGLHSGHSIAAVDFYSDQRQPSFNVADGPDERIRSYSRRLSSFANATSEHGISYARQPSFNVADGPGEHRYSYDGHPKDLAVHVHISNCQGADITAWVSATYLGSEATVAAHIAAGRGV
jgi:hypothetical protein